MLFYHFTCLQHLALIAGQGLSKGDVPTSRTEGVNAVWLTASPFPDGHGLDGGIADKRRVRLSVDLPSDDPALRRWRDWAGKNGVAQEWYRTLDRAAGGGSKTWWLYFGVIPPNALTLRDMYAEGKDQLAAEWKRKTTRLPGLGT